MVTCENTKISVKICSINNLVVQYGCLYKCVDMFESNCIPLSFAATPVGCIQSAGHASCLSSFVDYKNVNLDIV